MNKDYAHTMQDDLISRQDALDEIGYDPDDTYDRIKALPSRLTEYKTFCGVPIEEAARIVQEHNEEPKTGKWKLDPNGMDWNIPAWRCSECGFVANYIGVEANGLGNNPMNWAGSKFCPQCGVRITGYER